MKMGDETFNLADQNIEYHIVTLFERLDAMRKENPVNNVNVPARTEIRSLNFWRAVAAECMASFLYVFIVCGAAGGAGVGASTSSLLTSTALASGLAIATVTLCFNHISGAHVNPAVSAALAARRLLSPLRATLFIAAQCGGGIAAAALLYGVSVPGYGGGVSAALWPAPGAWERCGAELVLTATVVLAHCAAAERRHTGAAPLALGAAYAGCGFVSMPYLNPARSLGPSFVLSRWENHWVYWLGPMAGGVLAGLIYEFVLAPRGARGSRDDSSSAHSDEDAYDELDKGQPTTAHGTYRAAGYCGGGLYAPAPEPLYSGSKSLYCRSPPLTRANLHRSQSVYSKANGTTPRSGPLVPAQSLYPLPHGAMAHAQNAANQMQARPAAVGAQTAASTETRRPESVYGAMGARRGQSALSDDSSYGSYCARGTFGTRAAPRQPAQY